MRRGPDYSMYSLLALSGPPRQTVLFRLQTVTNKSTGGAYSPLRPGDVRNAQRRSRSPHASNVYKPAGNRVSQCKAGGRTYTGPTPSYTTRLAAHVARNCRPPCRCSDMVARTPIACYSDHVGRPMHRKTPYASLLGLMKKGSDHLFPANGGGFVMCGRGAGSASAVQGQGLSR